MKKFIYPLAIAVLGLAACQSENSKVKDYIPGRYVNEAQSEYSVANDTLIIEPARNTESIYTITRKTGFRRITQGKLQSLQQQVKHWTGEWDGQKQTMQIMQTGNVLLFNPEKGTLLNGNSEYRKL
jgi:recombinational DNA repair ATPase RecF